MIAILLMGNRGGGAHYKLTLLNRRKRGPIRSVLLVIIGWLVTQFSQKRLLRIFLIFCIKLADYKGRKVTYFLVKSKNNLKSYEIKSNDESTIECYTNV